jgi:hypothetical protein
MLAIRKKHPYFLKWLGGIVLCLITIFFLFWMFSDGTFKYSDHFIVELLPQDANQKLWIGTDGALSGDFLKSHFPQLFNDDCIDGKSLRFEYRFTFYKESLLQPRRQIAVFNEIDMINRNNINDSPNFRIDFDLKRSCLFEFLLDKQTKQLHITYRNKKGDLSIPKRINMYSSHFLISCDIALYVSINDPCSDISSSPIINVMTAKNLYFCNTMKGKVLMLKSKYNQGGVILQTN